MPYRASRLKIFVSTLPKRKWDKPETRRLTTSEECTVALTMAGLMPMASSTDEQVTL
jgi:hypothetical protein